MDREAWRAAIHGVAKSRYDWVTELNWTESEIPFHQVSALVPPSVPLANRSTCHHAVSLSIFWAVNTLYSDACMWDLKMELLGKSCRVWDFHFAGVTLQVWCGPRVNYSGSSFLISGCINSYHSVFQEDNGFLNSRWWLRLRDGQDGVIPEPESWRADSWFSTFQIDVKFHFPCQDR